MTAARHPFQSVSWAFRGRLAALGLCTLALLLTGAWAEPRKPALEVAATDPEPAARPIPPQRITQAMLARWPRLLREEWREGLTIAGRERNGRWSRTMSNGVKWHKEHGERQVYTYPGQNGQTFDPFRLVERDGKRWLRITARATPAGERKAAWNQPIQSGVLANYRSFAFTYGYVEARVVLPDAHGAWPAFWLLPNDNKWPPEIDVFEHINHVDGRQGGLTKVHVNSHWWRKATKGRAARGGYIDLPKGGRVTEPHLYGVLWTRDYIAHYIDRERVMVVPNPGNEPGVVEGLHKPMHLIFTLTMGGQWPGPVAMDKLPVHMDITDIGVWQVPQGASQGE